ncbi:histidine phosphatase family protein [Micromonospora sp. KC207]|uniref:histidine phosphatase family protein n=1 Tax=Micromonospora sp. KC207 TaxID=2530377 RepID=UPI0010445594|nr:histidine phosphatase family protein [Micromonospora sp. KC207]TDC59674.1 histidine phosphatase family protein [Micromonospora sp. KC207]
MSTRIVFETHSWSEDNDRGVATGWLPGRLSARGRALAAELGARRRDDGIAAIFTSDLRRAVETAEVAFAGTGIPILHDWRLRECDYGTRNGTSAVELHRGRVDHLDSPYPGGESWRQAVSRAGRFLDDVPLRWDGCGILLIGHVATRWALDHLLDGVPLEALIIADFAWREGWEYRTGDRQGARRQRTPATRR